MHHSARQEGSESMILTVANQKGGTAKSTTAAAIAQAAAHSGKKTLVIDLDPQSNLTYFLAADGSKAGSYELLNGQPAEVQHISANLDAIAASWDLQTIVTTDGSARRLKTALRPLQGFYSLVIIDTPPTAGELQYNALMASDSLVIPLQADICGLQGLYQMASTARRMQRSNSALTIKGYILTRYSSRSTIARQMAQTIQERAEALNIPFLMAIREGVAIREAQTLQRDLYQYAPTSKPAADYMALYEKLMQHENGQ